MNQITPITSDVARPAHFADIPGIIDLYQGCLEQSGLEGMDVVPQAARDFLIGVIESQKSKPEVFNLAAFVTGEKGVPTGVIVGVIQPLYLVLDALGVSDLIWYTDQSRACPSAGLSLLTALHDWADGCKEGPVLRCHNTNSMAGVRSEAIGRFFQRKGYTKMGEVYWKGSGQ